jgi:hypothetical protein
MSAARLLAAVLLAAGVAAWLDGDPARAHGGNFRSGTSQGPPIATPEMPGGSPPPTTERPGWTTGTWTTWWLLNRDGWLPDKKAVHRRAVHTADGSLFGVGQVSATPHSPWARALDLGARQTAIPFLLGLVDPGDPQDERLVAAALIALGRACRDGPPVAVLEHYARDPVASQEVQESAVLALGLLRRSDATRQLPAPRLEGVRRFLVGTFDGTGARLRVRAFAAYALGMLADQPYGTGPMQEQGRLVVHALWTRLRASYPSAELPVALLTALGMQPRAGVPSGVFEGLRALAAGRPLWRRRWDGLLRSHALTAYVRLRGPGWLPLTLGVMRGTREHVAVRAAAAIALRSRAGDLDSDDCFVAARAVLRWLPREPHWFAAGLQLLSLGSLLCEDVRRGDGRLVSSLHVDRVLCRAARDGRSMTRPFAGLALGLAAHGLAPRNKASAALIETMRAALERGLRHGRGADDVLGAYAVGLGLAGAESAYGLLLGILQDRRRGASLRGHCAVALAEIGRNTPELRKALQAAVDERLSPEVHVQAVRALSLLAAPHAVDRLLQQLATTRSRYAVAVIAGALGRLGDPRAAPALVRHARDPLEDMEVRVMSVVALGLIFDPEPVPTRVRMSTDANYPARTPALTQIFNIM